MEDILTKIVLGLITVLGFSIMGWLFKRWLDAMENSLSLKVVFLTQKQTEINGSVKDVIEKHHDCREELPGRFVGKVAFIDRTEKVDEGFKRIYDKIDSVKDILIQKKGKKQ